ncbi:transcriptional regulator, LysR family domain protein [Burkholderia pseudomallei]|nr:transcriptional regulator, LysR family domain protein [Burkholderia pseudomallei]
MKSGARGASISIPRSAWPATVSGALMRTAEAGRACACPLESHARAWSRAYALSAGATESSRSTMSTSAPHSEAFEKRSARVAGVKSQLRNALWSRSHAAGAAASCGIDIDMNRHSSLSETTSALSPPVARRTMRHFRGQPSANGKANGGARTPGRFRRDGRATAARTSATRRHQPRTPSFRAAPSSRAARAS